MEQRRMREEKLRVVTTKPCYGLPTSCPNCLPLYFYLIFTDIPFDLTYLSSFPDSEQIPYVESGSFVAYNNENGGIIECGIVESLMKNGFANLDYGFCNLQEWITMKAMIRTWLEDALTYELWVVGDRKPTQEIYFSDLPWPIGPVLYFKKARAIKQRFGITSENAERIEAEIYKRASLAYEALSYDMGNTSFLFGESPTSLDALFLGHALITTRALPDTSVLKSKLLHHTKLVEYMKTHCKEYIGRGSSWPTVPSWSSNPSSSSSSGQSWASTSNQGGFSNWSTKPKTKPKRQRTEEEKKFRRRAKYFLGAQLISVLVFLSLFGGSNDSQLEVDEDDDGIDYYD